MIDVLKLAIIVAAFSEFALNTEAVYSATKSKTIRDAIIPTTYDPLSRPSSVTDVKAKLSFLSISELNIKGQRLTVAGWLTLEWEDSRLTWTPATNDDIEYVFVSPSSVWKPEVVVDNSIADLGIVAETNLLLRVKYDGTVEWEPPKLFTVHCSVEVTYFPFDQQKCAIEVISWGFRKTEVTLTHLATAINLEDYVENGEFEITETNVGSREITDVVDGATVIYPQLDFFVYLKRRPEYHTINTLLPIVLSAFLLLVVFKLPAESGEKASYALTMLLALAVLLTLINDSLPETSITTSILGVYLAVTLILASAAVLATVFILDLHNSEPDPDVTSCPYLLTRFAARIVCHPVGTVTRVAPVNNTKENEPEPETSLSDVTITYKDMSMIWDKVFFIFFLVSNILTTLICFIVLVAGGQNSKPA